MAEAQPRGCRAHALDLSRRAASRQRIERGTASVIVALNELMNALGEEQIAISVERVEQPIQRCGHAHAICGKDDRTERVRIRIAISEIAPRTGERETIDDIPCSHQLGSL